VICTAYNPAQNTSVHDLASHFLKRLADPKIEHDGIKRFLRGMILCTKGVLHCIRVIATRKEFTVEELKEVHAVQSLFNA